MNSVRDAILQPEETSDFSLPAHKPSAVNKFFLNFSVISNTTRLIYGRSKD